MIVNRGIDRVNVGDFVNKVAFLKPTVTRNKRGAITQDWEVAREVFGKLTITPASEEMVNQNIINPDNIEFTTYVLSDVTSECRMRIEGRLYAIVSVNRLLNQPLMVVRGEKITER